MAKCESHEIAKEASKRLASLISNKFKSKNKDKTSAVESMLKDNSLISIDDVANFIDMYVLTSPKGTNKKSIEYLVKVFDLQTEELEYDKDGRPINPIKNEDYSSKRTNTIFADRIDANTLEETEISDNYNSDNKLLVLQSYLNRYRNEHEDAVIPMERLIVFDDTVSSNKSKDENIKAFKDEVEKFVNDFAGNINEEGKIILPADGILGLNNAVTDENSRLMNDDTETMTLTHILGKINTYDHRDNIRTGFELKMKNQYTASNIEQNKIDIKKLSAELKQLRYTEYKYNKNKSSEKKKIVEQMKKKAAENKKLKNLVRNHEKDSAKASISNGLISFGTREHSSSNRYIRNAFSEYIPINYGQEAITSEDQIDVVMVSNNGGKDFSTEKGKKRFENTLQASMTAMSGGKILVLDDKNNANTHYNKGSEGKLLKEFEDNDQVVVEERIVNYNGKRIKLSFAYMPDFLYADTSSGKLLFKNGHRSNIDGVDNLHISKKKLTSPHKKLISHQIIKMYAGENTQLDNRGETIADHLKNVIIDNVSIANNDFLSGQMELKFSLMNDSDIDNSFDDIVSNLSDVLTEYSMSEIDNKFDNTIITNNEASSDDKRKFLISVMKNIRDDIETDKENNDTEYGKNTKRRKQDSVEENFFKVINTMVFSSEITEGQFSINNSKSTGNINNFISIAYNNDNVDIFLDAVHKSNKSNLAFVGETSQTNKKTLNVPNLIKIMNDAMDENVNISGIVKTNLSEIKKTTSIIADKINKIEARRKTYEEIISNLSNKQSKEDIDNAQKQLDILDILNNKMKLLVSTAESLKNESTQRQVIVKSIRNIINEVYDKRSVLAHEYMHLATVRVIDEFKDKVAEKGSVNKEFKPVEDLNEIFEKAKSKEHKDNITEIVGNDYWSTNLYEFASEITTNPKLFNAIASELSKSKFNYKSGSNYNNGYNFKNEAIEWLADILIRFINFVANRNGENINTEKNSVARDAIIIVANIVDINKTKSKKSSLSETRELIKSRDKLYQSNSISSKVGRILSKNEETALQIVKDNLAFENTDC